MAQQASATPTAGRGSEGRISGYVLKVIRESIGQTQEQLAGRLGVSAATVQGWESGRRRPREESWTRYGTPSRSRADTDMGHLWLGGQAVERRGAGHHRVSV